ncbi:hypothetical protein FRB98_001197 [Tulasnella sp. 332]|nr:hypothetical protein FRB98_001197 [Tulasnella sp. 332]
MPPRVPRSLTLASSVASSSRTSFAVSRSSTVSLRHASAFASLNRGSNPIRPSVVWRNRKAIGGDKRLFHASSPSSASPKNPYEVLGVAKDAAAGDIKKTYFNLAKKYHPDTNKDPAAKEKFLEIQAAYDILSDSTKRKAYDQYGAASQQEGFDPDAFSGRGPFGAGGFGGFQDFGGAFGAGGGRSQADIFETLFGAFGGGARPGRGPFGDASQMSTRGDDIEASVGVSFLEAAKGAARTINITPVINCKTCTGSGLKAGAKRTTCSSCSGTGTRTFMVQSGFQMATTCQVCHGTGSTVPKNSKCGDCDGVGKVKQRKSVEVKIPAGVEEGMVIRVPGGGDMPVSGKGSPGDLLVRVGVTPSKVFRRQGSNIFHDAKVPFHLALLGGRVRVPTLDGEVDVRIPGGTQQGEECVLKGRGILPVFGGEKGDLFVTFSVTLPRHKQRQILQQYVNDIEGRSSAEPGAATSQPLDDLGSTSSTKSEPVKEEQSSGEIFIFRLSSFKTPDAPSSDKGGGWLSWALNKLKRPF